MFQPRVIALLVLAAVILAEPPVFLALAAVLWWSACLSLGYLIFRSGYLPRTIGVMLAIAGACYLVNSFSHFLNPAFGATLFPALFVPIFLAELSLTLWLIVKGVDTAKWHERAGALAS